MALFTAPSIPSQSSSVKARSGRSTEPLSLHSQPVEPWSRGAFRSPSRSRNAGRQAHEQPEALQLGAVLARAGQALSQPPQWLALAVVSTQVAPHAVGVA